MEKIAPGKSNNSLLRTFNKDLPSTKEKPSLAWFYSGLILVGFSLGVLVTTGVEILSRNVKTDEDQDSEITEEEKCREQGGRYDSEIQECLLTASDEGNECSSNEDCEGWCLAKSTSEIGASEKGSCSKTFTVSGCTKFIDYGKVNEVCLPE